MNQIFLIAGHNTAIACLMCLMIYSATRLWRKPSVAHLLWLLVLLRLIAPPIYPIDWQLLPNLKQSSDDRQTLSDVLSKGANVSLAPVNQLQILASQPSSTAVTELANATVRNVPGSWPWEWLPSFAMGIWIAGAIYCLFITSARIWRFERHLRDALPASDQVKRLANNVAEKLGLRQGFDVRCAADIAIPMLWSAGRLPLIVLPLQQAGRFDERDTSLILAHELAHLKRRDNWVRMLETLISAVYWWNPLVWFVRKQLHQVEDLSCDAWVQWAFPEDRNRYAEILLEAAESLAASSGKGLKVPACSFLSSMSLKGRIQMILENRFAPRPSTKSLSAIALFALLVLPSFIRPIANPAVADDQAKPASSAQPTADLPTTFSYSVKFEQGATKFLEGDKITIEQVQGTADSFTAGNTYEIKGTYTLTSHDRASLSVYVTAVDAKNGRNVKNHKSQTMTVDRGTGTFNLILPMTYPGLPHVSFYPADGGEGFGGNYFGTGDSVLKEWWKSNSSQSTKRGAAGPSEPNQAPKDPSILGKLFKYKVPFEIGSTQTTQNGQIEIREVWGTRPKIEIGGQYLVRGKYVLPSEKQGKLHFYASATGDWGTARLANLDLQTVELEAKEGEFELVHGMSGFGYFHLILTNRDSYSDWFADVYFGSGDNVYRKKP